MDKAPNELSATEARALIASGRLTAEALVRSCLDRIHEREPDVAAWAYLDTEHAIAQARRYDAHAGGGTLAGIPVGFKDIVDTADMPTTYGSPIYRDHRPVADAVCVAKTREAGGIVLGKTVTTEFASRYPGPTRNPHHPAHTPGGSSSGSAAAVADRMVPLAIGTQTAGSVIRPASYCGVIGYKPTFGLFSFAGVRHLSESVDTLGCMARTLDDIALFRSALLGVAPVPVEALSRAPRIGVCRTHLWDQAEPYTPALIEEAAGRLAAAGAHVADVSLPADCEASFEVHQHVTRFEVRNCLTHDFLTHPENLSRSARDSIRTGAQVSYPQYIAARARAAALRGAFERGLGDLDVIITPSAPGEAPLGLGFTGPIPFNYLWTLLHVPALTLPVLTGPSGLPVGLQVVARRLDDDRLLSCAARIGEWLGR
jgi:Asp-tRNA(Asn)/Glu-tRNA(Gln) amidotransferase A subunit family amidase